MKTDRLIIQTSQLAHIDSRQNLVSTVEHENEAPKNRGKGRVRRCQRLAGVSRIFRIYCPRIHATSVSSADGRISNGNSLR